MAIFTQLDITALMSHLQTGKANAIHAIPLARLMNYPTGGNQVKLRQLITYAINHGELIVSLPRNGYWKPDSLAELERTLDSLESRAVKDCDRRNKLISNWNNQHYQNQTTCQNKHVV